MLRSSRARRTNCWRCMSLLLPAAAGMLGSRCSQSRADTAATRAAAELRPAGAESLLLAGLSAPCCLGRGLGVRRVFSFVSSQNMFFFFLFFLFPPPSSSKLTEIRSNR